MIGEIRPFLGHVDSEEKTGEWGPGPNGDALTGSQTECHSWLSAESCFRGCGRGGVVTLPGCGQQGASSSTVKPLAKKKHLLSNSKSEADLWWMY